jgi:hypothetical protein
MHRYLRGAGLLAALVPACVTGDGARLPLGEATSDLLDVTIGPKSARGVVCEDSTYSQTAVFQYGGKCTITNSLPNSTMTISGPSVSQSTASGSIVLTDVPASSTDRYTISVASSPALPSGECSESFTVTARCEDPIAFWTQFVSDGGDEGQCNSAGYGLLRGGLNQWTPAIRIDTDGRAGGCLQRFGVTDPASQLAGLVLAVSFFGTVGADGQCDGGPYTQGTFPIPVVASPSPSLSQPYRIDTDDRGGGCVQTFTLSGRSDIELDVDFFADGDSGQCQPSSGAEAGVQTVKVGHSVSRVIDADSRTGGCQERFRLHRPLQ